MSNTISYWRNRFLEQGKLYVAHRHFKNYSLQSSHFQAATLSFLKPYLENKFRHALDFGCGVGRFTAYLNKYSHKITGLDVFADSLAFLKRRHKDVNTYKWEIPPLKFPLDYPYTELEMPMDHLPFDLPDEEFDFVWSVTTLQHLVYDELFKNACEELYRVSSKECIFILIENISDESGHVRARTEKEYLRALKLDEILIDKISADKPDSHWLIIGKKRL